MSTPLPKAQGDPRPAPLTRRAARRALEDTTLADLPARLTAPGSGDGTVVAVLNPTTGGHLVDVEVATAPTVQDNLVAAEKASRADWAWLSGEDRTRHLFALADVLADHARTFVVTAALTTGRPVALGGALDTPALLDAAFSAAGWADKLPTVDLHADAGVVELTAAWHTPVADLTGRAVAALAAGRAVVLRPRPAAAAVCARLARAADTALPPGLLRTVPAAPDTVADDVPDLPPAVDVVLAGADLDACTAHLLTVVAGGAQQRPGGTRVLVEQSVTADLVDRLKTAVAALRVGDPLDRATHVGPCPTAATARAATGVRARPAPLPPDLPPGGWWAPPAVVPVGPRTPPTPAGPVLGVRSVESAAEALALLETAPADELTVWGARPGDVGRWLALPGARRLGVDAAARPDRRSAALALLRGLRE